MKITYLLTSADDLGGTERALLMQAEQLADRHDVEILSVFKKSDEPFLGSGKHIPVRYLVDTTGRIAHPVRTNSLDDAACARLAGRPSELIRPEWEGIFNRLTDLEVEHALRDIDTDVLVSPTPALMALAVRLAPSRVVTVHQEHRVSELRGSSGEPLQIYGPGLDALVTLTDRTRTWFADSFGANAPRLATIPNASPDGFRPKSTRRTRRVVMAGRLVDEKQVNHAIEAFAKASAEHPGWTLRILGGGPKTGTLRSLIQQLDMHDRIELLGTTPQMAEEWAQASICLLTSRVEAFPLVLVEAQAAGVPVVSYDCPNGPGAIITHESDGYLVPPNDQDELALALGKLMSDEARLDAFGAAALVSSERYTPARIGAMWEQLYTELVRSRNDERRLADRRDRVARHASTVGGGTQAAVSASAESRGADLGKRGQEVRIEALHPDLVRVGGLVSRVDDAITLRDVLRKNLDLVADALEGAGIPYVMVRDSSVRHQVAVEIGYRDRVVEALREHHRDEAVYVAALTQRGSVMGTSIAAALDIGHHMRPPAALRVFQPIVTSLQTLHLTGVYGCAIAFWDDDETGENVVSSTQTALGTSIPKAALIPAVRTIGDRSFPTIEAFTKDLVTDRTFPIDAVYTWVDGADSAWLDRKDALLAELGLPTVDRSAGAARFRNRDELRYSLRSIEMYAPWIRNIYIVTDRQAPAWLDTDHPRVKVVDHRDIFTDPTDLPTFNSHAIESQLHHIDGLAEHFLYLNDDFFFGRLVESSLFYLGNGQAQFFMSPTAVPPTPVSDDDDFNFTAAKNNRELIEKRFGRTITQAFLHAPYSLRRSVMADLEAEYPQEFRSTAASRMRSRTDHSIPSSLHHYFGFFTERCVPGRISCGFVNVGLREHHERLSRLLSARPNDVFCLNDYHDGDVPEEEQHRIIHAFLESYFPVASSFEKGSPQNLRSKR